MRRVVVTNDNKNSLDQRTENLVRDVTRQLDNDLRRFGFRGSADNDLFGRVLSCRTAREDKPQITTSITISDTSLADFSVLGLSKDKPFSMNFDLRGFRAEDIKVSLEDGVLGVSARQEMTQDGATSAKEFNRRVKLPENVNPENLNSFFTNEGILTIEAAQTDPSSLQNSIQNSIPTSKDVFSASVESTRTSNVVSCTSDTSASGSLPLDTPIFSVDSNACKKMNLLIEVGLEYEAGDVTVKLEGRHLEVEACKVVKGDGKSSKISLQRQLDLTEDLEASSIRAELKGGRLHIRANVEKTGSCKVIVL